MKTIEYRGWTIEVPPADKRYVAFIWRPGSRLSELFHAHAEGRDAIIDLAQAYIDHEIEAC